MKGRYVRIIHQTGTYPAMVADFSDTLEDQTGCQLNQVRLGPRALATDGAYKGWLIKITSGSNNSQTSTVTEYNGTSKIATLKTNWVKQVPDKGSTFILVKPEKAPFTSLSGRAILNFTELGVYPNWTLPDSGTNLALAGTATMSGNGLGGDGKSYPASNAIDGSYANFTLSGYDGTGPVWWMVDLRNDADIYIIRLVNRRDAGQERMLGFQFQILDSSSKVIYTSDPITTSMHAYEVFPPSKVVQGSRSTGLASASFFTQFTPFSACSVACGGGTRKRVRGIVPDNTKDVRYLSTNPADLVETEPCNTQTCPVFSAWSPFTDCVAGKKTRTRTVVSGIAGAADLLDTSDCTELPTYSDWTPYTDCIAGKKSRTRTALSGTAAAGDLLETTDCTVTPTPTPIIQTALNAIPVQYSDTGNTPTVWERFKTEILIAVAIITFIIICSMCKCCFGRNKSTGNVPTFKLSN